MGKRILIVVAAALLCAGVFAVVLHRPTPIAVTRAENQGSGKNLPLVLDGHDGPIYLYHASFHVDGVLVRADRAVINQREVALQGNVRMTLPPQ